VCWSARRPGSGGSDLLDREMICAIPAHAGLALEQAQIRRENENLRRLLDRTRIADSLRQIIADIRTAIRTAVFSLEGPQ
jgi:predicted RNA binding protein with dsRBD fold (UPF0201 family)